MKGGCQEDGTGLFSLVPSERTRGNETILEDGNFHLNMRKNSFTVLVSEQWDRLPGDAVESPSLEIFKTHVDAVLCPCSRCTCSSRVFGRGDLQISLPATSSL